MLNKLEAKLFKAFQKNVKNPNFFLMITIIIYLKIRYNDGLLKQPKIK